MIYTEICKNNYSRIPWHSFCWFLCLIYLFHSLDFRLTLHSSNKRFLFLYTSYIYFVISPPFLSIFYNYYSVNSSINLLFFKSLSIYLYNMILYRFVLSCRLWENKTQKTRLYQLIKAVSSRVFI